jgi:hypothetical protein
LGDKNKGKETDIFTAEITETTEEKKRKEFFLHL